MLRKDNIDELMDALDDENKERMLKLIDHLKQYFDQIIIISHDDDLLGKFENTINLSSKGG